jgi:hypothetical protein
MSWHGRAIPERLRAEIVWGLATLDGRSQAWTSNPLEWRWAGPLGGSLADQRSRSRAKVAIDQGSARQKKNNWALGENVHHLDARPDCHEGTARAASHSEIAGSSLDR